MYRNASSAVTGVVYTNDSNSASDCYIQITVSTYKGSK